MENFKSNAREVLLLAENRLRSFDIIDFGIFGMSFMSIGYLLGAAKRRFKRTFAPLFAIIGILSTAYLIIKIFFKDSVPYTKLRR